MPFYKLKKGKKHYWKQPLKRKGSKNFMDRLMEDEATIECDEYELGGALDKFVCLDKAETLYKPDKGLVVMSLGGSEYDVVNEITEEKINDKPMTLKEARKVATGETILPKKEKPIKSLKNVELVQG